MKIFRTIPSFATLFCFLIFAITGCSQLIKEEKIQTQVAAPTRLPVKATAGEPVASEEGLPKDLVCMVNNAYMGKKQVPVAFDNKMYYGCCNMCAAKIKNNRKVRYAIDPLTGREVDKALAFITLKPGSTDEVLYFESEGNFKRYQP